MACSELFSCIALHCIALHLHCIALHCIALHCICICICICIAFAFAFALQTELLLRPAHALRFPLDSDACLSAYLRNLQLHRRGVMDNMGGVYTAPTLLILLYSTVVVPQQRALLERAPRSYSQASKLDEPRCISILLYIMYNSHAHTMVSDTSVPLGSQHLGY